MVKRLIIVSGLSGSGKTVALNVLEDLGYFAIDNLPITLLDKLTED
ncbi:MAG: RNase adapter RapZ, partial [Pseudomonadota bacterium]